MSPHRVLVGEALRLEVLSQYAVVDSAPDPDFDDLVRVVAAFCGTPIALVSLVDADRQWFKARIGVTVAETPREISFCTQTIKQTELLVVPDTAKDPRFADQRVFPDGPPIRFYAGAPLLSPEGTALGTLCVMDYAPRELDPAQRDLLQVLSRQVMSQLELRRRNSDLAARESLLFTLMESEPEGVLILEAVGKFKVVNPAGLNLLDAEAIGELSGRVMSDFVIDADRQDVNQLLESALEGQAMTASVGIIGIKGSARWLSLNAAPLFDHRRHVVELVVIARDITDRRYSREEREKLMLMIERMPELVAIADLNGRVTFMNAGGRSMIGFGANDDISALHFTDYVPEASRDFFRETVLRTALEEGIWSGEMQLLHLQTGALIDVHRTLFVIRDADGAPRFFGSILRDISARTHAEKLSRESESRYRTLFEYAPDGILIATPDGVYVDVNASVCSMLGYTREELIGADASAITVPDEHVHIAPALQTLGARSDYQRAWTFRRKDGAHLQVDVIATTMPDGNILAMLRDVTERRRIDDRFRRLIESNIQGVLFFNLDGRITDANDAFLTMTGYSREDLRNGEVLWNRMTPSEYADVDRRGSAQLESTGSCSAYEKEFLRKDGTRVPILIGSAMFRDTAREGVSFVFDLSERKKLEQQYLRAQRMESIGTLAGGIAHDLNNVLGPIVMAVDLLRLKAVDAETDEMLELVKVSALRGADMVRQVLSFARGVEGRRMEVQIRHLVRDIEKIITETLPKNIEVRVIMGADLWTLTGEPTQLHQVLMNLCVNARDAMPEGGRLTISAENHPLDAQYVSMNPEAHVGPYILLQVEDTGTGMSSETIEHAFDPFFTTKEFGKGTGLGLSTSLAIVKSHGGFIRIYSELGVGTSFRVYLPAQVESAGANVTATPIEMPRGDGETVLVVDDEAAIRQITQQTLLAFGYRVVCASDGAEAIAIYAARQSEIDVVVTDMMMPVLDGPATIQVLRRINPKLPVIAVSGLSTNGQPAQAALLGIRHFLPKPYTAEALLVALRSVLTTGRDSA